MIALYRVFTPYLKLMKPHLGWLLVGALLTLTTLIAGLGLLALSGGFLTATAIAGLSAATAQNFNFFQPAAGVRFFAMLRTGSRWGERVTTHEATFRILAALRVWLFEHLAPLSPQQLQRHHSGELLNRLTRDIDALDNLYLRLLLPVGAAILLLGFMAIWLGGYQISLLYPIVGLAIIGLAILPRAAWLTGRRIAPQLQQQRQHLRVTLLELVDGLEELSLTPKQWQRYWQQAVDQSEQWLTLQWQLEWRAGLLRALMGMSSGLAMWVAIGLMADGPLEGPWVAAIALLLLGTGEMLQGLPMAWQQLPGTAAAAQGLTQLAAQVPLIQFPSTEQAQQPKDASLKLHQLTFTHSSGVSLLSGINLDLPAGSHCLIQGPSGGGKSTLCDLLTRRLDYAQGDITVGGVSLSALDEHTLRQTIAYTPQSPYLFTHTLAENLRLASPNSSDEQLWQILETVGLSDAVRQWPDGLNTWIDEAGSSLSGGQRHRLGIARALLVEAPITILDEPSEGLDIEGERALIQTLTAQLKGRTLIWVSHRETGLSYFSHRALLKDGQLALFSS